MTRPQGRWPTALAGALAHVGIASLLVLLEMEQRSGILEVRCRRRAGLIAVRQGRVVRASVGGRPLPGCDAVCELIRWTSGKFVFRVGEVEHSDEIALPTTQLLLEAARRTDERAARLVA
jgi:hypothetical protein